MGNEFVSKRKMNFVEGENGDSFWGGVDESHGHRYELYIGGPAEGPSERQVSVYSSFVSRFDDYLVDLREQLKQKLLALGAREWARYKDKPLEIDIISVDPVRSSGDLDLVGRIIGKGLLFKKVRSFGVTIKDGRILEVDL